jgi:hypothetical protein
MRYGYPFRKIPLTQGKFAIVDPERYEEFAKYKWYATRNEGKFYAVRHIRVKVNGKSIQRGVRMHRQVLKPPYGKVTDHINHNRLDNRIENLRIATPLQNSWNMLKQNRNCTSKYKGVIWVKGKKKWRAKLTFKGRPVFIGYFDDERAAAQAYDTRAKELFGEFAALNFPARPGVGRRKRLRKIIKRGVIGRLRFAGKIQWLAKFIQASAGERS